MKKTSSELKRLAREKLNGNWGFVISTFLVAVLIPALCMLPFTLTLPEHPSTSQQAIYNMASFIISFIEILFACGLVKFHLALSRTGDQSFGDIMYAFSHKPLRFIGANILFGLLASLPTIPGIILVLWAFVNPMPVLIFFAVIFIAAGIVLSIIISLQYSLLYCLLIERPEEKVLDLFRESKRLMKGNKGRAFYINLSFIGLVLLAVLSFGIGMLWVGPYMSQTQVQLYLSILDEQQPTTQTEDSFEDYVI